MRIEKLKNVDMCIFADYANLLLTLLDIGYGIKLGKMISKENSSTFLEKNFLNENSLESELKSKIPCLNIFHWKKKNFFITQMQKK